MLIVEENDNWIATINCVRPVMIPLHSLADDVATVKRAIDLMGGPVILVGHSYGGFVITNAAYNNPNVKPCLQGLVYIAAHAPNEGQSLGNFFDIKFPKDLTCSDALDATKSCKRQ